MSRCAYCKKQGADKKTAIRLWGKDRLKTKELDYCSDVCKQNIHYFAEFHNKYAPRFTVFVLVWLFLFLAIPFTLKAMTGNPIYVTVGSPAMMVLMGAVLIRFPIGLSTTKWAERLGIKYTNLYFRLTGVLLLFAGINLIWETLVK
ncbi:MAG: hypothetical protein PHZ03_02465 [Syntrophomonas sp.]|nr:hypothetical protein [Syntrophomonas sp.]